MDSGGADLQSQLLFYPEMPDSFDDFLNCSHRHGCDPLSTSAAMHSHSCLHAHTQVIAVGGVENDEGGAESSGPRRALGNREAVRKYREKKKAHEAFLEEEVKKLRATNQHLLRRLQNHAALEAEAVRLRSLLLDVRGKIDAEVAGFPFPKQCGVDSGSAVGADPPALCFNGNSEVGGAWEESSGLAAPDRGIDEGSVSFDIHSAEKELGVVNALGTCGKVMRCAYCVEPFCTFGVIFYSVAIRFLLQRAKYSEPQVKRFFVCSALGF